MVEAATASVNPFKFLLDYTASTYQKTVASNGSCEHGNETWNFFKGGVFID
jgi:hypothetical protein